MEKNTEEIPDPKEIEKEIGEFLNKRFGGNIKIISPGLTPQPSAPQKSSSDQRENKKRLDFDLKPSELVSYLDQYIIKQDRAKEVLATKICTHFNRIKHLEEHPEDADEIVGNIKSNILMAGPTGVGKTYMVKLIAKKLGVPFAKGDATKFSETGYVGGDVDDLIRELVHQADDDIELAQCGIVYIDEIDKIAGSSNLHGADISRTGVQRALLKPMEDTDVELKVPHDPISMMQELSRFQETGSKERRVINTGNILFIVSGAFQDISPIIKKRLHKGSIGFGSEIKSDRENAQLLKFVNTEDLVEYGFEAEFIGRLPVRTVFETLSQEDLFQILKQPNSPIVLSKKLDFAAYGIDIKFEDDALRLFAERAFKENTGARGLVSAVEEALLPYESRLPVTRVKLFPVTRKSLEDPATQVEKIVYQSNNDGLLNQFMELALAEKESIRTYIQANWKHLSIKHGLALTKLRVDLVASHYCSHVTGLGNSVLKVKSHYDKVRSVELEFLTRHDINVVLEDDAIDVIMEKLVETSMTTENAFQKLTDDFELGLKLVQKKTGQNRFFIGKKALEEPENYISSLLKQKLRIDNNGKIE